VPHIEQITPTGTTTSSPGVWLIVEGSGFVEGTTGWVDATELTTVFISDDAVTCQLPPSMLSSAEVLTIHLTNPGLPQTPSNTKSFWVKNPKPVITHLDPASTQAGGPAFDLSVYADDLMPTSELLWDGSPRSAVYQSRPSPRLVTTVRADEISSVKNVSLAVANPEPRTGISEPAELRVTPQLPRLASAGATVCEIQGEATVEIVLTDLADRDVVFDVATVEGTAVEHDDYRPKSETLTIPAGSRSASVSVEIIDDAVAEDYERFSVRVTNVVNATITDPDIPVSIADQDGAGAMPGDASGDCGYDARDLALILKVIDWPAFHPYGNPDCSRTGDPIEANDLTCVLHHIY
jgi:hypothetical protein